MSIGCIEQYWDSFYSRGEFPLKSNNCALNIACGNYDKIEFNDFLGNDKPFDVDCSIFRQAENIYMNN